MSSVKGRTNQSWNTPQGLVMKVMVTELALTFRLQGYSKTLAIDAAYARFERQLPYHQSYWKTPRTKESVTGRAMTCGWANSKPDERPWLNKKMQPYYALAKEFVERKTVIPKDELDDRATAIANHLKAMTPKSSRRKIKKPTMDEHIHWIQMFGGRCPCCGVTEIVRDGAIIRGADGKPIAEGEHFFTNQQPDFDHTWIVGLLCCHRHLTSGKMTRLEAGGPFNEYHRKIKHQKQKVAA
jgi:hypothetical protein